jgi:hypothetical protein
MMKTRLFPSLVLISLFLASCAPGADQSQPPPDQVILEPSVTPIQPVAPITEAPTQDPGVAQPPTQAPLPVATSRGPDLHATDPTTVSLASGQYQFVEFFRFT